jgi:hypothetical protein
MESSSGEAGASSAEAVPFGPTKAKETLTPPGNGQGDVNSGGVSPANGSASDDASPAEMASPKISKVPEPRPTATEMPAPRPVATPPTNAQGDVSCSGVLPANASKPDASAAEPPQSSEAHESGTTATKIPAPRPVTTESPTTTVERTATAQDVANDLSAQASLPPTPEPVVDVS